MHSAPSAPTSTVPGRWWLGAATAASTLKVYGPCACRFVASISGGRQIAIGRSGVGRHCLLGGYGSTMHQPGTYCDSEEAGTGAWGGLAVPCHYFMNARSGGPHFDETSMLLQCHGRSSCGLYRMIVSVNIFFTDSIFIVDDSHGMDRQ